MLPPNRTTNTNLQYMQNNQYYDMHCQQDGDADGELGVEGLVAEEPHGQHTAQAAADGAEGQQRPLPNAPAAFDRFYFIGEHKEEGQGIYYQQIEIEIFHKVFPFGRGFEMKKLMAIVLCGLLLSGCSQTVFETMGPVDHVSATVAPTRQVTLQLPESAAVLTVNGSDTMYICDGFSMAVQTLSGGDVDGTIRAVSGFTKEQMTVMETVCGDHRRFDFVWTAAGELGDLVCRAAVIDDGSYHYCLTAMVDAGDAAAVTEEWNRTFGSFCLER